MHISVEYYYIKKKPVTFILKIHGIINCDKYKVFIFFYKIVGYILIYSIFYYKNMITIF